ncbi:MAG: pyridoxamine 5'-phosphate oxidase [Burkholderiales bacterium]|nr:pyridoxamine 5'-phosphate oxidase [Burkholderiales bacterium]
MNESHRHRRSLLESHAPTDPLVLFDHWYREAIGEQLALPEAMTLATTTDAGHPAARVVLLKAVEDGAFVFYTNYESRKGRELDAHAHAALVFHWVPLERQVRIEGTVARVSDAVSDAYFATRPLGSRRSALASPQSKVIPDRHWLDVQAKETAARYGDHVPRPPHWGGYSVIPALIEFWQGRDDRLHDRLSYRRRADGGWLMERLAP